MSTLVADVKAALDGLVGSRVYRDAPPDTNADGTGGPDLPFVVVLADVNRTRALYGDGAVMATVEVAQVDLWQDADDEDDALIESAVAAINGLAGTDGRMSVQIDAVNRFGAEPVGDDAGLVHHAITVRCPRVL